MALQTDSAGFLVGDPIDLGRLPGYLRDIKSDVAAIRKAVLPATARKVVEAKAPAPVPRNVPRRDGSGRFVATPTASHKGDAALVGIANRLRSLAAAGSGADDVDPAVKAFKEVAEPMQRGLWALTSRFFECQIGSGPIHCEQP